MQQTVLPPALRSEYQLTRWGHGAGGSTTPWWMLVGPLQLLSRIALTGMSVC